MAATFKKRIIINTANITDITTFPSSSCAPILLIRNVTIHIMMPRTTKFYGSFGNYSAICRTLIRIDLQNRAMPILAILLESSVGSF